MKNTRAAAAEEIAALEEQWHNLPLLFDPPLRILAERALAAAVSTPVSAASRFCATVWRGKFGIEGGRLCESTVGEFVDWLREEAQKIAPKGEGWVACPIVNPSGVRTNAATRAVWALNLDSDGRGTWGKFLESMVRLGLGCIAYQSGGWTPAKPKWHALVFLSQPFDVSTPEKVELWKAAYNRARVVLGALAGLLGEGFDPTVETPCVPVFITERRKPEHPPREVVFLPGTSLDLDRLAAALPATEVRLAPSDYLEQVPVAATKSLKDEELNRLIEGLYEPMSKILSSRRDLYMALPGALLDRGVAPDDVLAVIEEISDRCPGDQSNSAKDVAEKHREHVHCARTTIARWERGEAVTRIGTIAEGWPEVAHAIDDLLPDPSLEAIRAIVEQWRKVREGAPIPTTGAPMEQVVDLRAMRRRLGELRNRRRRSPDVHRRVRGLMLDALLGGEDFTPYIEPGRPAPGPDGEPIDRDRAVGIVGSTIAYRLPVGTPFEAVAEIARPSLHTMLRPGETLDELLRQMERSFLRALGQRVEGEQHRAALEVVDGFARGR